jgi:hypothetical protein
MDLSLASAPANPGFESPSADQAIRPCTLPPRDDLWPTARTSVGAELRVPVQKKPVRSHRPRNDIAVPHRSLRQEGPAQIQGGPRFCDPEFASPD